MDPLAITSAVIAISGRCILTARALYDLRGKYRDASMTITAIYSESTVISTSLAHIQGLCTANPDALRSTLAGRPELEATFDQALTGCVLVYSVLDGEVRRLYAAIEKAGLIGSIGRIKLLWKEDAMRDVLMQIRGQQTALGLLIQALQMSSIQDIRILLENNTTTLKTIAHQTSRFRHANPSVKAPGSVLDLEVNDVASLYSVDSVITSTDFIFDDLVVNSQAYRRVLMRSKSLSVAPVQEQPENSSATDTVIETIQPGDSSAVDLGNSIRRKLSPTEVKMLWEILRNYVDREGSTREKMNQFKREHVELREKYQRVKKCFFKQEEYIEALKFQKEELSYQRDRILTERDELEQSQNFLKEENRRHTNYFHTNEEKRKFLFEAHEKEAKAKNLRICQLEDDNRKQKEEVTSLRSQNEILSEDLGNLREELRVAMGRLHECDTKIVGFETELKEMEEEMQRYKGLESIIEQLRLLSPVLPLGSPKGDARLPTASRSTGSRVPPDPLLYTPNVLRSSEIQEPPKGSGIN